MATEKIDLNNLDKSDWKTYRFDEIAQNISERVDPNNTDLEVYIGLEHIDSESLHIKRHGTPDDVNGTKLKFYKDDIIFGRRRAYQRKAGIATCDGFCSAHALVLRANPDVIGGGFFVGNANQLVPIAHARHHGGHRAHGADVPLVGGQGFCLGRTGGKEHKFHGKGGIFQHAGLFCIPHGKAVQARLRACAQFNFLRERLAGRQKQKRK